MSHQLLCQQQMPTPCQDCLGDGRVEIPFLGIVFLVSCQTCRGFGWVFSRQRTRYDRGRATAS